MTIYKLIDQFKQLLDLAETEDLPEDAVKDTFESLTLEFEEKAENTAIVIKELEATVDKLKKERDRLNNLIGSIENNIERLKKGLETAMRTVGKTKFKTKLFSFNIQKNGGRLPVIIDVGTEELPEEYVTVIKKPNLAAIANQLNEHPDTDISRFAHFGERGESLRIR